MSTNTKFKTGTILSLTVGQYSDFHMVGIVVTLKDIDLRDHAAAFLAEDRAKYEAGMIESAQQRAAAGHPYEVLSYMSTHHPRIDNFVAYLVKEGLVAPVDQTELHLGDYDTLDFDDEAPNNGRGFTSVGSCGI